MKNKIYFLVIFIFSFNSLASEHRTLVKIPFEQREFVLKGMRKNLGALEDMLKALSLNDFAKVESVALTMLLNDQRLKKLATRENDQFIAGAMEFHTNGVTDIIKSARKKNLAETLQTLSTFVGKCNACHAAFRLTEWPAIDYPPAKPKIIFPPKNFHRSDWVKKELNSSKQAD